MEQVRLIEPDGTESIIVPYDTAIKLCKKQPGWTWRYLTDEEKATLT